MKTTILIITSLLFTFETFSQTEYETTVEIWIRAFIPDAKNAGKAKNYIIKSIDGKSNVLIADESFVCNYCFSTDQRGFSTNEQATSRIETKFKLSLKNGKAVVTPTSKPSKISETKNTACITGKVLETGMGKIERDNMGAPSAANNSVQVIGQVQTTNTLVPVIPNMTLPSIDYSYDIIWNPNNGKLKASITSGSFPAIEVYARRPAGKWKTVLQKLPTGSPWSLYLDGFGINSSTETKEISILNQNRRNHYVTTNTGGVSYGGRAYGCTWNMKYNNVNFSFNLDIPNKKISSVLLSNVENETANNRNCYPAKNKKDVYNVTSTNFSNNRIRIQFSPRSSNYHKCNAEFNGVLKDGVVTGTLKWKRYDQAPDINYTITKQIKMQIRSFL